MAGNIMANSLKENMIKLQLDTSEMSAEQVRMLKTLFNALTHTVTTDEESDFFDGSAECMRICAALIKQSNFVKDSQEKSNIPYSEQVLEYSLDLLNEQIQNSKVIQFDN